MSQVNLNGPLTTNYPAPEARAQSTNDVSLEKHQTSIAELRNSTIVQMSGAKRVFTAIASLGISEAVRASRMNSIRNLEITINQEQATRVQEDKAHVDAHTLQINQSIGEKLVTKGSENTPEQRAVQEAFEEIHTKFGDDIMPNVTNLHTSTDPKVKDLAHKISQALNDLPTIATTQDIKNTALEQMTKAFKTAALEKEVGNLLISQGHDPSSAAKVCLINSSYSGAAESLERARSREGIQEMTQDSHLEKIADIIGSCAQERAKAMDEVINLLSDQSEIPRDILASNFKADDFEQHFQKIDVSFVKSSYHVKSEYIKEGHQNFKDTIMADKSTAYSAVEDLNIPQSLKDQWQNQILSAKTSFSAEVLNSACKKAESIDTSSLENALATKNIQDIHTNMLDVLSQIDNTFGEKVSAEKSLALEYLISTKGLNFFVTENSMSDLKKIALTEGQSHLENTRNLLFTSLEKPQNACKALAKGLRSGELPAKYELEVKKALENLRTNFPEIAGFREGSFQEQLKFALSSSRLEINLPDSHQYISAEDFGAIVYNAAHVELLIPQALKDGFELINQTIPRIAAGIQRDQAEVESLFNIQPRLHDMRFTIPSIVRDNVTKDPASVSMELFQTRPNNFIEDKIATYNSLNTLNMSPETRQYFQNNILKDHSLKKSDFFPKMERIAQAMDSAQAIVDLQSATSVQDKIQVLIDLFKQMPKLTFEQYEQAEYDRLDTEGLGAINTYAGLLFFDHTPALTNILLENQEVLQNMHDTLDETMLALRPLLENRKNFSDAVKAAQDFRDNALIAEVLTDFRNRYSI